MKPLPLLVIPVLLIASACTAAQAQNDAGDLANSRWSLVSFGEADAETPVIEGTSVTLEFDDNGQAGGHSGCNAYGGTYTVQNGTLMFGELVSTLIACAEPAITDQEQQYRQALRSAGRYALDGDTLTIWFGDDTGRLNFVRAPASTPMP